jgi:hypothetical protein
MSNTRRKEGMADNQEAAADPQRLGKLSISWSTAGLVGHVSLDGEHWASVEWSEKRQRWCVEIAKVAV